MKCIERVAIKTLRVSKGRDGGYEASMKNIIRKVQQWNKKGGVAITASGSGEQVFGSWAKGGAKTGQVRHVLHAFAFVEYDRRSGVVLRGSILRTS